jgi:hypothetical protein
MVDVNFLWKGETLWLLELSSLGQFTTLELQEWSVLYSIYTKHGLTRITQKKYIWQNSSRKGGLRVSPGKGRRLTVCHAGSAKTGFIPESKWIFRSRPKMRDSDYHSEMNANSFKDWFGNRFLNYVEEGSILTMDNASYHSTIIDKFLTQGLIKKTFKNGCQKTVLNMTPQKPHLNYSFMLHHINVEKRCMNLIR